MLRINLKSSEPRFPELRSKGNLVNIFFFFKMYNHFLQISKSQTSSCFSWETEELLTKIKTSSKGTSTPTNGFI